ncbi:DNA-3-methyladenine glycosylase [Candidatus Parcubacteria bacterium]|nr:DNA-3-methyladenine glycosylase [Candidatus Parcubacteria bacterium]
MRRLTNKFFRRKTLTVAKNLIGKFLVRKIGNKTIREKITEVEAYIGPHDLASHSSKGRTPRTEVMYQDAGTIYVYFIYGVHWMLNIVTEERDFPAAVLIRSTERVRGPGRVTKEFGIDRSLNGKKLGVKSGLWIEDGAKVNPRNILRTPRIGVSYAKEWSEKPYRFILRP